MEYIYTEPRPAHHVFFMPEKRTEFYSHDLRHIILKAEECYGKKFGVYKLEFDFIASGQDPYLEGINILQIEEEIDYRAFEVSFKNNGQKERATYHFVKEYNGWRINEVTYYSAENYNADGISMRTSLRNICEEKKR